MNKVSIYFYLEGRLYASRLGWTCLPRVGDEIMLGYGVVVDGRKLKTTFKITRIVFGVESDENDKLGQQAVNIEIIKL